MNRKNKLLITAIIFILLGLSMIASGDNTNKDNTKKQLSFNK